MYVSVIVIILTEFEFFGRIVLALKTGKAERGAVVFMLFLFFARSGLGLLRLRCGGRLGSGFGIEYLLNLLVGELGESNRKLYLLIKNENELLLKFGNLFFKGVELFGLKLALGLGSCLDSGKFVVLSLDSGVNLLNFLTLKGVAVTLYVRKKSVALCLCL